MPSLPVSALFTPADSGVDPTNPAAFPGAQGTWLATLYYIASKVQLSTTVWGSGGISRTLMAIGATALNAVDQIFSIDLQGGLLQWAAAVTPDPANVPAPLWTPGWLDQLGLSLYDVERQPATYATVTMTIVSAAAASYPTFAPGTYHVSNPSSGFTYSNVGPLTIAPGTQTAAFIADVIGQSTSTPGAISQAVTALPGVSVTNLGTAIGANAQSNASYVASCRNSLSALSPNGPKAAYQYLAEQSFTMLQTIIPGAPAQPLTGGPITSAICLVDTDTGTTTTVIANASGTDEGVSNLQITGASNTAPITLAVSSIAAAGGSLKTGDWVNVSGVTGNGGANGWWQAGTVTDTSVVLIGSTGTGAYVSGGALEGGDLGLVDYVLQAYAVGNADTNITEWAEDTFPFYAATIAVPLAQLGSVAQIPNTAAAAYIQGAPIGGYLPPVVLFGAIPAGGVEAAMIEALGAAGITVLNVLSGFIVGGVVQPYVALSPTQKAVVASPSQIVINVVGA